MRSVIQQRLPVLFYLLFFAGGSLLFRMKQVPVSVPAGISLLTLCVSLLAVIGGSCAAAWLLRRVRYRAVISLILIPAAVALYMFGTVFEAGLYTSRYIDSFDYIMQGEDYDPEGTYIYDPDKNAVIHDGQEYPPQQVPNPDYSTGISRIAGAVFEVLDPYAGCGLELIRPELGKDVPVWILLLYVCKSIAICAAGALWNNKKINQEEGYASDL